MDRLSVSLQATTMHLCVTFSNSIIIITYMYYSVGLAMMCPPLWAVHCRSRNLLSPLNWSISTLQNYLCSTACVYAQYCMRFGGLSVKGLLFRLCLLYLKKALGRFLVRANCIITHTLLLRELAVIQFDLHNQITTGWGNAPQEKLEYSAIIVHEKVMQKQKKHEERG